MEQFSHKLNIITPMYNAAATIQRTVKSLNVIAEENRKFVVVWAVDDGSTDNSAELFVDSIKNISGIEYNLMRKDNGGSSSARNLALNSFFNGWFLFLDADDELACDPVPLIKENAAKSAMIFAVQYFNEGKPRQIIRGRKLRGDNIGKAFSAGNKYHPLAIIAKRECLNNLFDETLVFIEDWHFWAVNPEVFKNYQVLPDIVLGRVHAGAHCKSADQFKNGQYRIMAAEKIGEFYSESLGVVGMNNFKVQKEIGKKQMGEKMNPACFFWIPMSFVLFLKLIIYFFFFGLYQKTYHYK